MKFCYADTRHDFSTCEFICLTLKSSFAYYLPTFISVLIDYRVYVKV